MILKFKRKLFGINLGLEIDTGIPILYQIYKFRLNRKWPGTEPLDKDASKEFIKYALRHLPKGSYVVFFFGNSGECFIQFANGVGERVLDVPFCRGNVFYGKDEKLTKLLHSENIKEGPWSEGITSTPNTFYTVPLGKDKKTIEVDLGSDYEKAAELALSVVQKVCRLKNPTLLDCETGELTYA